MALILNIETATTVCSVALSKDGKIVASKETGEKNAHSSLLTVLIEKLLKESRIKIEDIDAVAVSKGPGSYTGLRIGVSVAKGFCYALDKYLISLCTLQSMAYGMTTNVDLRQFDQYVLFCPMIDARRMEVYSALYDLNNNEVREVQAEIIDANSFSQQLITSKVVFFGDGSGKCKEMLSYHPNAVFFDDFYPSSIHLAELAEKKYHQSLFEDIAYFEPFYLKDFIAGKPRVKGLF